MPPAERILWTMAALDDAQLRDALADLPEWREEDGRIVRDLDFATYAEGLAFVQGLGVEADRRDHHPDILLTYRRARVALSTHDAGGITAKDLDLARWIETRQP